jgi:hypothetical protein
MKQRKEPNQSSSEKKPVSSPMKRQYQGTVSFFSSSLGPTSLKMRSASAEVRPVFESVL